MYIEHIHIYIFSRILQTYVIYSLTLMSMINKIISVVKTCSQVSLMMFKRDA